MGERGEGWQAVSESEVNGALRGMQAGRLGDGNKGSTIMQ
jgi:hypothetical protein